MSVYGKLQEIQRDLKAPKGQRNKFGNYNYRSCEDVLEAVKPLAHKLDCIVLLSDQLVNIGDRFYIEATATLVETETKEEVCTTALARESLTKKGMDDSQITGTASSYARKYALNGLFAIDDTKDGDTNESKDNEKREEKPKSKATVSQVKDIIELLGADIDRSNKILAHYKVTAFKDLSLEEASQCLKQLKK